MSGPTAALCSYRLGGTDGVSVEAAKWEWALSALGFEVRRVAGDFGDGLRPDDTWLPFLAIDPPASARPEPDALAATLAGVDLVVVENICSLPLNVEAAEITAGVLARREGRVLFHHHDLPWERPHLAHLAEFPPRHPNSLHVTINRQARDALSKRGIEAVVIHNSFDLEPEPGDRDRTRRAFGFGDHELVVLQPTRAIPRKEVGTGIRFAESVGRSIGTADPGRSVRFWITGPAEDGFDAELDRLVESARVPVTVGRAPSPADAYAAADIVVLPSSWEGFGNPVIEALIAGRPLAVARYPVLEELLDLGLTIPDLTNPGAVARLVETPDLAVDAANRACLRAHFALADLPDRIRAALTGIGWDRW